MIQVRKRFGQHFLHDQGVLQKIIDALRPVPGQHIVEIGPGPGALTALLLACVPSIDAVEIDRDLAAALRLRWPGQLHLHECDALRFDFSELARIRGGPLRIVGNLPYNISTPLLFHLLQHRSVITDLHVMLQREVVDRMAATAGTDDYGRLSVMLAPWFGIQKIFDVGPGAFHPPPRVWSSVARLVVLQQPRFEVPELYGTVVAQAFSQRRKTIRNSLKGLLPEHTWAKVSIDPSARPETLRPEQFAQLAALAQPYGL